MPVSGVCQNILKARHTKNGYGSLEYPEKFNNQDYQQLKQYCLIRKVRYIDDMFPPDKRSIGPTILKPSDLDKVVWARPMKIVPNPSFIVDGLSRFDFGQGMVGNCWFLASIGSLTFQKNILAQVVPMDQMFDENYCGLFHFRFWRFGRWVDVVIDDKLPTINGRLIFVHSKDPTEFWPALLEKAYAKVCGSYSDMNSGTPAEALVDFTGGVHICVELSSPPLDLWELMCRAGQSKSLMGCGTPQGGHAYAVTGVKEVMSRGQPVKVVRLWNPWGNGEWKGDWSDGSPLWQTVSPQERDLCLAVVDDGEFWMPLEDFCKFYSDLDICCLCPDFLDGSSTCHWKKSFYEGRWVAGTTAGGCLNNRDSFWTNPQYRVKIDKLFENCANSQREKNMLVSLMQKPDKRNRRLVQSLHIGFSIFAVPDAYLGVEGKFPASFFTTNQPVAQTKRYMNAREYLIVPSTFNPNETASFLLTIISKAETHVHESSSGHNHQHVEGEEHVNNGTNDDNKRTIFRQFSDKYEEVDAEQLQMLLNENILKGDLKSGGFSVDACRSMVALMDTSITGKLNSEEFVRLWGKINTFKDIFFRTDVSRTGTLSMSELRNAIMAIVTYLLLRCFFPSLRCHNTMTLVRPEWSSSGQMSLENFISLVLRFECMSKIFNTLSSGMTMTLQEPDWLYLSMYT
ncbi:hypothetical protein WMY93_017470 [Mugilogobius chulae]|uniref:Calpain catalytic domain-containing protein n=1 Tax=Mugilogobius chulae TaxID=88201 RepID=A0AAW0NR26_9GOBI